MKLWVDDYRYPPEGWVWAQNSEDAMLILVACGQAITHMSLDHDLGGDDTTRPLVLYMAEHGNWPTEKVTCHSDNPVGREWIEGMVERYQNDR